MKASPGGNRQELQSYKGWTEEKLQGNKRITLPPLDFGLGTDQGLDVVLDFSFTNMIYSPPKRLMQNTNCPHSDRKHYAKNMCSSCYHKTARPSRAWKCGHSSLPLYAKGRCHDCYVTFYYRKRPLDFGIEI